MARPFCVRCDRMYGDGVRRSGRTRYCETCHAALRATASQFCTHCRRDVPTSQYVYSRSRCRACAHPTVVGRSQQATLPPGVTRCTCCGILIGPGFLETTNYAGRCGSCVRWHSRHTPQPMVFDEEWSIR